MAAIELAQPRVIPIPGKGRTYSLTVGVIPKKAWLDYFDGIVSTSENSSRGVIDSYDSRSARVELAEKVLVGADGYGTSDGSPVTSVEGWQKLIPMSHRIAVADTLVYVMHDQQAAEDEQLMLGQETVYLKARWGADDSGALQEYSGLVHRFKTPTGEHQRRYQRAISRSMIIGGARTAKTRWLGAQRELAELYDELIQSVDGYTVNGQTLTSPEAIVRDMDTYHKVAAAERLFAPAMPQFGEEK